MVKLCCGKDLAGLHGEGCFRAVPFAHIPVVPREVQTMDGGKYDVGAASSFLLLFRILNFRNKHVI